MDFDEGKVSEFLTRLIKEKFETEAYRNQVREGVALDMSDADLSVKVDCANPCILLQTPLWEIGNIIAVATVYRDGGVIRACLHPPFDYADMLSPEIKKVT